MASFDTNNPVISQDERIMAALAHGSILLPFTGAVVPIIIWITHKEKSSYAAFQSLQALLLHLALLFAWVIGMGCYIGSFFSLLGVAPLAEATGRDWIPAVLILLPMGVLGGSICGGFLVVIYGLVGAVMTLMGKNFRYLLIGSFLERRLQNRQPGTTPQ